MTQVTEIFDTEGKLLGWVNKSDMFGGWRALSPDGWVVHCATQAEAEAALEEGRRV